ncbi:MAG: YdeI/OmpD-associated family protein [Bdellovibrionales bacterium]|nr:YdeI/OmpD-associated family protein [Bdellovibrionales bacterium]
MTKNISSGTIHKLPTDFKAALFGAPKVVETWEDITPLARNEWICWVTSAKLVETRARRIKVGISKLKSGMRRPCCWAGCPHRKRSGK